MKLLKEDRIIINGQEFSVKLNVKRMMLFEEMSGRSIAYMQSSLQDLTRLLYVSLNDNNMTYEQFVDFIDEDFDAVMRFKEMMLDSSDEKKN